MRSVKVIMILLFFLLPPIAQAGPRYVEVTAEKPQKHIHVEPSHLGEGFWAFSITIDMKDAEIPSDLSAYLILRNEKGNLLSTPIKSATVEQGKMQFYAAIHSDLLKWAQINLRDSGTEYEIKLESFKKLP